MVEVFVPLGLFLMIFLIIAVVMFFRFRSRQELQMTVRAAIDSGQALSADVLQELTAALHPQRNDLRRGIVLVAIALGFVALAFAVGSHEEVVVAPLLGISAFPFFTGLAYLALWFFNRDDKSQTT